MSRRSSRFAALVSILCGLLVFSLFRFFPSSGTESGFGRLASGTPYAVLALDESQDDRHIREILTGGGIKGLISESSQEVPIDDFGVLKMVPLDSFRSEIETFDPRDDGYAAKLQSFFVRGGKRFFFFPLKDIFGNGAGRLKKQLGSLLGDIPFTFTVLDNRKPFFWYFALLAAACAFALYLSHSARLFAYELPVLLAFGWAGSSGFVLAAALAGIWELLREPAGELSAARRYKRNGLDYAGAGFEGLRERLKPFRINCLLSLFFAVFFIVFSIAEGLSFLPLVSGCLSFFFLYFLTFRVEARRARENRHILFTPVPLLPFKARTFSLFPLLLPFGAAAALALFLPLVFPAFASSAEDEPIADAKFLISAEDYNRHIDFENSFSYKTLDQDLDQQASPESGGGGLNQEGYLRYYLDEDGLIAESTDHAGELPLPEDRRIADAPPFPLEKLMDYLLQYNDPGGAGQSDSEPRFTAAGSSLFASKEWIPVAIILAAGILNLLRPGVGIQPWIRHKKKKRIPVFGDKRIAA